LAIELNFALHIVAWFFVETFNNEPFSVGQSLILTKSEKTKDKFWSINLAPDNTIIQRNWVGNDENLRQREKKILPGGRPGSKTYRLSQSPILL